MGNDFTINNFACTLLHINIIMKKILDYLQNFFFQDFWIKISLIAFTVLLSFQKWEGWPFLFLFAMFIGWIFTEKTKK